MVRGGFVGMWYGIPPDMFPVTHGYWSPRQPRGVSPAIIYGCVKVERSYEGSEVMSWAVEDCYQKLPFACMKKPLYVNGNLLSCLNVQVYCVA